MEKTIEIPEGVNLEKKANLLEVTGPKGTLSRELSDPKVSWEIKDNKVIVKSKSDNKRTIALTGTFASHIQNMVLGVTKGFEARLKVIYSHFPMKLKLEGNELVVQNFMGGRAPKKAQVIENVKVEVKKDEIIVTGINKEDVGQTAGRIEQVTTVRGFDRRVFQDGIHLVSKTHPME